jgi:hypothetical protein
MLEGRMAKSPFVRLQSLRSGLRIVGVSLAVSALMAWVAQVAIADPPKVTPRPRRHAGHTAPKKAAPAAVDPVAASTPGAVLPATPAAPAAPAAGATEPGDAGASVVESKTLDGGTRVFKFSELDIEGQLKSPQLIYFLRRVRAEFSAGDLGHRTFMREMSETRKEPSF